MHKVSTIYILSVVLKFQAEESGGDKNQKQM